MQKSKKPAQSKSAAKVKQLDKALRNALRSIEALKQHLPLDYDPESRSNQPAFQIMTILEALTPVIIGYLENAPQQEKGWNPAIHPLIASRVAKQAVEIAGALLGYARENNEDLKSVLETTDEWPAIISTDSTRDIRKVAKNPNGKAATHYCPVLNHLGKNEWFQTRGMKAPGIFHALAINAVEIIQGMSGWAELSRLQGLPSALDFLELPSGFHTLKSDIHDSGNYFEWCVALKYYFYLSLAPEPDRTRLREHWRKLREKMFAAVRPLKPELKGLHEKVSKNKPLAVSKGELSGREELYYPEVIKDLSSRGPDYDKPHWYNWWQETLQYEPAVLFGNNRPLNEWRDPAIIKIVTARQVNGRPRSGFGRCVNAVLDAFLRLKGVGNGLNEIDNRITPLPKFHASSIGVESISKEAEKMREQLRRLQPNASWL